MKYIYRMSRKMYFEVCADAKEVNMSVPEYVTAHFGICGKCIKVEII